MDEIDALAQPRCPECGGVLRDSPPGFECIPDGLLFIRSGDERTWTSRSVMDVDQWVETSVETDSLGAISKSLKDLAHDSRRRTTNFGFDAKSKAAKALLMYLDAQPEVISAREKEAAEWRRAHPNAPGGSPPTDIA